MVTTIHGFSSERIVPVYEKYNGQTYYVAISDADRHERLDYAATIHHGIDMAQFDLDERPGEYLLFFGRIHPEKGTAEAIEVATRAGLPLIIAGIIQDHDYFRRMVEPRLDEEAVRYLGPIGPDARSALLGQARALLHLIDFEEPFGFSVVEAMACGTPVVANRRGSMREIVDEPRNGFLVDSIEDAVDAVTRAASIDRREVRSSVVKRFDAARMVDDYLTLYRRILGVTR
jgi:glycosyltransferase involved in cell wall biosynthesis